MRLIVLSGLMLSVLFTSCDQRSGEMDNASDHPMKDGFYSKLKNKTDLDKPLEETGLGKIIWDKEEHDFGEIIEGDIATYTFSFTNTGGGPLKILETESRCGCTVANYSEEPVMPGESGELTVVFNSTQRLNEQSKAIIVHSNGTPRKTALVIRAFVKPKK